MTTIADKLTRIASAKEAIKAAIEAKGVEVANAPLADYAGKIEEIKAGEAEEAPIKDVNFMDYDGFNLYSYTWAEASTLAELPPLPSHEGLICQGWNYTLDQIKANGGQCDVGANYITDDGATRLYMTVSDERRVVTLGIRAYIGTTTVDWGDGTTPQTISGSLTHTYTSGGDYIIRITTTGGYHIGDTKGILHAYSTSADYSKAESNMLTKVELGYGVFSFRTYAFAECYSLQTITIPRHYKGASALYELGAQSFYRCHSLRAIVLPAISSSIATAMFRDCTALQKVSWGYATYPLINGDEIFYGCFSLNRLALPANVTAIGASTFYECRALRELQLPEALTSIGNSVMQRCFSMVRVIFPATLTSIGNYAFQYNESVAVYDFSRCTAVPTLGTAAFTKIASDCQIKVPNALLTNWVSATNWSSWSDYIVGV